VTASPSHAPASLAELTALLPPRIWYLTSNGVDMWCRRPYGFFFSTGEAAEAFARQFGSEYGLIALGTDAQHLITEATFTALRGMQVTRIFVDPQIDPATGDVFGQILRLGEIN
jgi:hypothetical protein